MANRTVQFRGFGVGTTPTSITASFNGSQVFSGQITTLPEPVPGADPTDLGDVPTMFTLEIPMEQSGSVPMSITATGNPVTIAQVWANYANVPNVSGNTTTFSSSGADGYVNIFSPWPRTGNTVTDSRANVVIDGMPQIVTAEQRGDLNGTWWWDLGNG
jgi:hypothetical protein